jgi:hypothetical protein
MRQRVRALRRRVGESLMLRSPVNRAAAWILAVIGPAIVAFGLLSVRSSASRAVPMRRHGQLNLCFGRAANSNYRIAVTTR